MNAAELLNRRNKLNKAPLKEWSGLEQEALEKGRINEARSGLEGFFSFPLTDLSGALYCENANAFFFIPFDF